MAFDSFPGGDPRGPSCPKCGQLILKDQPTTTMHFDDDPYGHQGQSGRPWHAECARPYWDKFDPIRKLLGLD